MAKKYQIIFVGASISYAHEDIHLFEGISQVRCQYYKIICKRPLNSHWRVWFIDNNLNNNSAHLIFFLCIKCS